MSGARTAGRLPGSVVEVLERAVASKPGQEALVDHRRRLTYRDLADEVDVRAADLAMHGVGPGDRVAVSMPNGADVVVCFLAVMRVGAVWVGIHPALAPDEKAWMISDAEPRLCVSDSSAAAGLDHGVEVLVLDDRLRRRPTAIGPAARHRPHRGEPAAIAYTSGTTGRPKGVVHDQHHTLLPGSVILHDRMGGRGERVGVHLPLTTLNLMILGPLLAFQGGGTCICTTRRDGPGLARWIADEGVEHLSTAPAVVHDLVHHPDVLVGPALRKLRLGVGGSACPEDLRVAYRDRFGRDFTTGYGLTEAPSAVTQETERVRHVTGGSGAAMAHVEVVITDSDGVGLPRGAEGEICVGPARRGPWAGEWRGMIGYWRRPDHTASARRGELLRTGDIGHLDDAGLLHVADRRDDIIVRGGSNVSPAEVARVLLDHPAVADCLVLGRPHARLGQEVMAVVEPHHGCGDLTGAEIRRHCSARLAGYKVPAEVLVVAELPRNSMGKVAREQVRAIVVGPPAPDPAGG